MTTDPNNFLAAPSGTAPTTPSAEQRVAALEARLAQLEPLAARGQQALAADSAALAAKVAALGADQRAIVERLPESERAAVADQLARASWRAPPTITGGPPAPAAGPVDVEKMAHEPGGLAKLKRDYPEQWSAYCRRMSGGTATTSSSAYFARPTATALEKALAASQRGFRR